MSTLPRLFATLGLLALACAACTRSAPDAADVYQMLLAPHTEGDSSVFLSNHIDGSWFRKTSADDFIAAGLAPNWRGDAPWLSEELAPIIQHLFLMNQDDGPLEWEPKDNRVVMLDGRLAAKPSADEIESMCLVAEGDGTTSVLTLDGRQYRSYLSLSRVAMDPERGLAAAKYAIACAPLSGAREGIVILQLKRGKWEFIAHQLLWIS